MSVPDTATLAGLANATRDAVRRLRPSEEEQIAALLATAAFQLQSAHVGVRLLDMCYDAAAVSAITEITNDHTAIEQAITNLVTRSPASAVDLCAAALARLAGCTSGPLGSYECSAAKWKSAHARRLPAQAQHVGHWFSAQLASADWTDLKAIRDPVTHRTWPRDIQIHLGGGRDPQAPTTFLAIDYKVSLHINGKPRPLVELAPRFTRFALTTYETLCNKLAAMS